ncbi:hypothetical protein BGZ93_010695 [Podila epicladia]|nr:hypothetical protein BGZ92_008585 [Podila epicladia]KAG0087865.1 hypothetical protein BGZ93_010695 [Podila epicladia]
MDPPPTFGMDRYIYTPLSTSGSIDNRSRITAWPTFNGSTNMLHQGQQLHYQPSKNPFIDGSIFWNSTTPILPFLPQSSLNSHSPLPAIYASLHSDPLTTTAVSDQDVLPFSQQQQYSSVNSGNNTLYKENLCGMRLAPHLNSQLTTGQSTLDMAHVDPVALVLSESSRSSTPSTEPGLSTPELNMFSSFTSTNATDEDILHPFLIDSFSRSLSLSPTTAVSSALLPSSSSSSLSASAKSALSPVDQVPAYYGIFMPDGTVYHFDGTSLVPAPMSRTPITIEPCLLETVSLVDNTNVIQHSGCGYMQVPPLVVDFFQGASSSLASSSFGPGMAPQTVCMAPFLTTDYNTIFSDHLAECPQVPTFITELRQDISSTPSSPSSLSQSSIALSSSSISSSSLSNLTASPFEILASLKPSAFEHSLPSSSCCPSPSISTSLAKQPRPSRPATAKSSKRSTRHQRPKKDLRRSSSSSSSSCSSSSSSSSLQGATPTILTRATAIGTTRAINHSIPRLTAKFPCPFAGCDYRYNLKRELNRHKNIHLFEDKDKYQCLHCNAGLCRLDSVKRHMEAKGKSACLEYGLYREFKPNGEVKRIRECKDNWYAAAVAARMKGK